MPAVSQLLVQLPLWISLLLLAFVLADRRYRQLIESAAAWGVYVLGSAALLPQEHAQTALACAPWLLVALLAWALLRRPSAAPAPAELQS